MVNSVEVEHSVEVEQLEYLGSTKLEITISVNLL